MKRWMSRPVATRWDVAVSAMIGHVMLFGVLMAVLFVVAILGGLMEDLFTVLAE